MASYYATMLTRDLKGELSDACGSFGNIAIDGRLTLQNAISVARESLSKERGYEGFKIELLSRPWAYINPLVTK